MTWLPGLLAEMGFKQEKNVFALRQSECNTSGKEFSISFKNKAYMTLLSLCQITLGGRGVNT
jgi:hypothetical protein